MLFHKRNTLHTGFLFPKLLVLPLAEMSGPLVQESPYPLVHLTPRAGASPQPLLSFPSLHIHPLQLPGIWMGSACLASLHQGKHWRLLPTIQGRHSIFLTSTPPLRSLRCSDTSCHPGSPTFLLVLSCSCPLVCTPSMKPDHQQSPSEPLSLWETEPPFIICRAF